jgi:hypothetical protein
MIENAKLPWVDCFIHKFARLYPEIPSYLIYYNRWNITFSYDMEGTLLIDFAKANQYFNCLLDKYGIEKVKIDFEDIRLQKNILLPCDSYFFPYSTQNCFKYHLEHYIFIREYFNGIYTISDDNPYYEGSISQEVINQSYEYFRNDIYQYGSITNMLNQREINAFLHSIDSLSPIKLTDFYNKLISEEFKPDRVLFLIESTRIPLKRFNAIEHMVCGLRTIKGTNHGLVAAVKCYTDELAFISNLSGIGWRSPERYLERIKLRLEKLKILEYRLNEELRRLEEYFACGDMI